MTVKQFFADMGVELKKVDWPTKQRVVQLTIVVLLIVAVMTVFNFVLDIVLGSILFK